MSRSNQAIIQITITPVKKSNEEAARKRVETRHRNSLINDLNAVAWHPGMKYLSNEDSVQRMLSKAIKDLAQL